MSDPRDPMGLIEKLQRQEGRHRMGETVALDRYGAMMKMLPQRQSKDPAVDRALRQAGPGYAEDRAYGWRPLSDAISGQLKPPLPPTLQEQPAWSREPVNPDDVRDFVRPYVPDEDWA